jgi:hypothetical protein
LLAEGGNLNTSIKGGEIGNTMQILGISEIGRQPKITNLNSIQVGTTEVGMFHDGVRHSSLSQVGTTEISSGQITLVHPTPSQVSSTKVSVSEVGSTQVSSTQISPTEVNPTQIDLNKEIFISNGASDPYSTQVNFTEIPLPTSKTQPKLISSHLIHTSNFLLGTTYFTIQTLWHTITPIELDFKVTHLPTGQLAEATITGYNSDGTPKSATISIDITVLNAPLVSTPLAAQILNGTFDFTNPTNSNYDWTTRGDSTIAQ